PVEDQPNFPPSTAWDWCLAGQRSHEVLNNVRNARQPSSSTGNILRDPRCATNPPMSLLRSTSRWQTPRKPLGTSCCQRHGHSHSPEVPWFLRRLKILNASVSTV